MMRVAADFPRREGGGGGAGVVALAGPLFGVRPEHGGEASAGFGFRDRMRGRRGQGGRVLPLRQFLPHFQRLVRRRRVRAAEGVGDVAAPAPARLLHARRQHRRIPVQQRVAALGELVQQRGGEVGKPGHLGFQADRRRVVVQRQRQAARRRRGGVGGADEREQFQQVERRTGAHVQAAERGGRMDQDRRRQGAEQIGGLGRGQQQEFAVRCQDGGAAMARDHGGCVGQRDGGFHIFLCSRDSVPRQHIAHGPSCRVMAGPGPRVTGRPGHACAG